jgi:hypothetical protein
MRNRVPRPTGRCRTRTPRRRALRFLPNNIADFAELELSQANFPVLERSNLGPLPNEITLAYNLGDPKAEQIAGNKKGFDGRVGH